MLKYKLLENELKYFEEELKEFTNKEGVTVINVDYRPTSFVGQEHNGWDSAIMHCALITYKEETK